MDPINRRDGVRVAVNRDIKAVILDNKIPCELFSINLAGLRLSHKITNVLPNLAVELSHRNGSVVIIECQVVKIESDSSILKFSPLTEIQRSVLHNMLQLQQACLPGQK